MGIDSDSGERQHRSEQNCGGPERRHSAIDDFQAETERVETDRHRRSVESEFSSGLTPTPGSPHAEAARRDSGRTRRVEHAGRQRNFQSRPLSGSAQAAPGGGNHARLVLHLPRVLRSRSRAHLPPGMELHRSCGPDSEPWGLLYARVRRGAGSSGAREGWGGARLLQRMPSSGRTDHVRRRERQWLSVSLPQLELWPGRAAGARAGNARDARLRALRLRLEAGAAGDLGRIHVHQLRPRRRRSDDVPGRSARNDRTVSFRGYDLCPPPGIRPVLQLEDLRGKRNGGVPRAIRPHADNLPARARKQPSHSLCKSEKTTLPFPLPEATAGSSPATKEVGPSSPASRGFRTFPP